jgi:GxxExxY protein
MIKEINNIEEIDCLETKEIIEIVKLIYLSSQNIFEQLGPGHAESSYQKSLMYELNLHNLMVDIERHISVIYTDSQKNDHFLTSERIDLYIHKNKLYNNNMILELKAVSKTIQEQEIVQIKKYLRELKKTTDIKYGIVINFPQPTAKSTLEKINFSIVTL